MALNIEPRQGKVDSFMKECNIKSPKTATFRYILRLPSLVDDVDAPEGNQAAQEGRPHRVKALAIPTMPTPNHFDVDPGGRAAAKPARDHNGLM